MCLYAACVASGMHAQALSAKGSCMGDCNCCEQRVLIFMVLAVGWQRTANLICLLPVSVENSMYDWICGLVRSSNARCPDALWLQVKQILSAD